MRAFIAALSSLHGYYNKIIFFVLISSATFYNALIEILVDLFKTLLFEIGYLVGSLNGADNIQ